MEENFFIQISAVIIYQTSNILISQFFGPAEVTPYNVAYSYYSIVLVGFGIVMKPFWSAFTEAYIKKDYLWIRKTTKQLFLIWSFFCLGIIIMTLFSNMFYTFWVGEEVKVPISLSILLGLHVGLLSFGNIFVFFVNGVGKIRLQLVSSVIGALLFIPCAILFSNYTSLSIGGVVLAMIIANFYGPILAPIQYYKILNKKNIGIWNK